jgi:hypothetical protein
MSAQTKVTKVTRADAPQDDGTPEELGHARWLVNDDPEPFDAIIATIGTCGKPKRASFPGMPESHGEGELCPDGYLPPIPTGAADGERRNGHGSDMDKSYAGALKSDESSSDEEKHSGADGDVYEGPIIHSSELDDADLAGKTIVVIGSGASGVEAIETALAKGARKGVFIARSDKVGSL